MNLFKSLSTLVGAATLLTANAFANPVPSTLDDFSDPTNNSLGIARIVLDDTAAGGQTKTEHSYADGILTAKGDIVPPRGQPGWASIAFLLDEQGAAADLSNYEGVALRIRINKGTIFSVSANSTQVVNFDYHAAPIAKKADGEFHEIKVPFSSMKRAWSEQTPLDLSTIASISLVAVGMQKDSFDYEIDEIGFY